MLIFLYFYAIGILIKYFSHCLFAPLSNLHLIY